MIRHAFLIIAHNEFSVLQRLISALDDDRIDFYVHIDRKVGALPSLYVRHSGLFFVRNRVDTRWGDVSQIETEYALFGEAYHPGEYAFYHLISGTHFPLKSVDSILSFYEQRIGHVFLDWFGKDDSYQETLKVHRYNFFTNRYAYGPSVIRRLYQILWRISSLSQGVFNVKRYSSVDFYKASNWVSLPENVLLFLLDNKRIIIKKYSWTFCGDEYFVPTELMNSEYRSQIVDSYPILYQKMECANPRVLTLSDFDSLIRSDCLFARKFSSKSVELLDKLEEGSVHYGKS